ncbi:MAG: acetyl-CoA carboxylase biotin carboxylase subunit [Desulfarculus sp.]|nr:MAG: acetyl-CoA carboxylase biotin carboxylase subunit [Desulfarculus sp.]
MFDKVLIANRGEIALRVLRTCQEMGLATVAVFSQADAGAVHVQEADQAVLLGPAEPAASYLNVAAIIAAAQASGAQAIHPGYGFLAENPALPEACEQAGLVFIGPPADVIRALGSKTAARRLMQAAGVPVIPGMLAPCADAAELAQEASALGYPVLLKARGGGGGKGMRAVEGPAELAEASQTCASEAAKAFGDPALYLEKCLPSPRHVEFQVLADNQGNVVHLFERECSIQRRHQKIIEETPCPALTPELRERMGAAAVAAARAAGYVNAGTVEFLLDAQGRYYFLEVNTRLQVEHPITEMTTGLDLVRLQLMIAAGQPLPFRQEDLRQQGHAIECRIYAEDPGKSFMPSPGVISLWQEPAGPGLRLDSGVQEGSPVPMEYDPILAKLVAWAPDREQARRRLLRALKSFAVLGVQTIIPFLKDVLDHPEFRAGRTSTDFIPKHLAGWQPNLESADLARLAYAAQELAAPEAAPAASSDPAGWPSPWQSLGAWRM